MDEQKLPIVRTAIESWRHTIRFVRSMTSLFVLTTLVSFGFDMATDQPFLASLPPQSHLMSFLGSFISIGISSFIVAPLLIATYRFILLGETTMSYRPVGADKRSLRFFPYLLLLNLTPSMGILFPSDHSASNSAVLSFLTAGAYIALLMFSVRFLVLSLVLFPALTLDVQNANVSNAFRDTRSRFWRLAGLEAATMSPLFLYSFVVTALYYKIGVPVVPPLLAKIPVMLASPLIYVAGAAMGAQVYRAYANRLAQSPVPRDGGVQSA